ncbi:MAG: DUF805 domain-containing protein [Quinella sp. 3Q1]|nr:DUF805 domain-containing protein [Quinella sp. 3Q1]MBR6887688.1 DUF805 domain-containing protein [Selenomonadaceae bacterium]
MELLNKVYTTEGRLNRLSFYKFYFTWLLVSAVVGFILGFIGGFLSGDPQSVLVTVPTGIWSFIAGIGSMMISVRRLHDLNKSGWWLLLALVPVVNIFFLVYIFVMPGTGGWNKYGADPLQIELA